MKLKTTIVIFAFALGMAGGGVGNLNAAGEHGGGGTHPKVSAEGNGGVKGLTYAQAGGGSSAGNPGR